MHTASRAVAALTSASTPPRCDSSPCARGRPPPLQVLGQLACRCSGRTMLRGSMLAKATCPAATGADPSVAPAGRISSGALLAAAGSAAWRGALPHQAGLSLGERRRGGDGAHEDAAGQGAQAAGRHIQGAVPHHRRDDLRRVPCKSATRCCRRHRVLRHLPARRLHSQRRTTSICSSVLCTDATQVQVLCVSTCSMT